MRKIPEEKDTIEGTILLVPKSRRDGKADVKTL